MKRRFLFNSGSVFKGISNKSKTRSTSTNGSIAWPVDAATSGKNLPPDKPIAMAEGRRINNGAEDSFTSRKPKAQEQYQWA